MHFTQNCLFYLLLIWFKISNTFLFHSLQWPTEHEKFYTVAFFFLGDNSDKLCTLCASKVSGQKCTWSDPYAGDEGAFKCLIEKGDIAFLRHSAVLEMVKDPTLFSKLHFF